jgi:hypothetical protein
MIDRLGGVGGSFAKSSDTKKQDMRTDIFHVKALMILK